MPDSPEPLSLLLAALPAKVVLEILKADDNLCRTVLQGFAVRPASLSHGPVRQRLERETARFPELATLFFTTWKELNADLLATLGDADFTPDAAALAPLLKRYGEHTLRYALLHAEREDIRAWAERTGEITLPSAAPPPPAPSVPTSDTTHTSVQQHAAQLQNSLHALQNEHETLKRELDDLRQKYQHLAAREAELRKQYETTEARLDREQRRARKAEEQTAALRKQLREMEGCPPETAASPELFAVMEEAIAVLRRGLERAPQPEKTVEKAEAELPPPPPPSAPRAPRSTPGEPSITLSFGRSKQTFTGGRIRDAIIMNDEKLVNHIRDGLAKLGNDPEKERATVETLAKAGIPRPVLTGPLHPAVVDGSNIANMSRSARGKLAYIEQVRKAAWEEGYFPVLIIVDASLRHQIDQADALMTMVERGEIRMVSPGTPADPVLIEETARLGATLITNDRMTDWPAAKKLEKRHAEVDRTGIVRLGNFHHSARWFF